jgi:hypothetical protein
LSAVVVEDKLRSLEVTMDAIRWERRIGSLGGRGLCRVLGWGVAACALAGLLAVSAHDASASTCTGKCAGKNWCERRTDTCGPSGGFGKCMARRFGGNVCAEILFQASSCAACAAPSCVNCICVLGAGGGDKCNNGVNGLDYICVRKVKNR